MDEPLPTPDVIPVLAGVELRLITEGDIAPLVTILSEPEVAAWWGAYDDARTRADLLDPPYGEGTFAIVEGAVVLGAIQYHEEDEPDYRHASLDVFLTGARRGAGLGPAAVAALALLPTQVVDTV